MDIVFHVIAMLIAAVLAAAIGRAGWIKVATPIVELAGSGVVWAKDIPAWSVRALGVVEMAAAIAILSAPIIVLIQGPSPLVAGVGVVASLGVALLMVVAHLFHRVRGEVALTWKTNLAFGALAVMAASSIFIAGWA